jgi:hypothetical protein
MIKKQTLLPNLLILFSLLFFLFASTVAKNNVSSSALNPTGCYVCGPLGCWHAVGYGQSECKFDLYEQICDFSGSTQCWGDGPPPGPDPIPIPDPGN